MKKIICLTLAVILALMNSVLSFANAEQTAVQSAQKTVEKIFETKNGAVTFDEEFLKNAGTTASDWFVITLKKLGVEAEYSKYLDALRTYVGDKYSSEGGLHRVKATEWHRISMTVEACGGDSQDFDGINLINDGIFEINLDKQGINAYLWGLVCLEGVDVLRNEKTAQTKSKITEKILSSQLSGGGFALSGNVGDVDVTATAITALSSQMNDPSVKTAVDKAVEFLSRAQCEDGGFESYGVKNCESSAQVVIALCSVNINPDTDERFVKNDISVLDAMLAYETEEGGFSHVHGEKPNNFATWQTLLAIASFENIGNGSIYNFKDKISQDKADSILSDSDAELVRGFENSVGASDIFTIKRLITTVSDSNSDQKNELLSSLQASLEKATEISQNIDYIDNKLYEISQRGVEFSDKKELDKLSALYEKLSDEDKKLVKNHELLSVCEKELELEIRRTAVTAMVVTLVICAVLYLAIRRKKRIKLKKESQF